MRATLIVIALAALAACSPPPAQAPEKTEEITTSETQTDPLAIALTPVLAQDIGRPVALNITSSHMEGDFGFIVAQPQTPEGAMIDWSQTRYAQRAADGVLDGNGTTYAILKRENGQWQVLEWVVGPTDVAWSGWAEKYDAPPSLFALTGDE